MQMLNLMLPYAFSWLAALLFLFTIKRLLPVRTLWRQLLLFLLGIYAVNSVIWIGDTVNILFVALGMFTAIPLLCKGQRLARFSVSLLLFCFIISSCAVLSSLRPPLDQYIPVFTFPLWLCIALFVRHFINPEAVRTIRAQLWLLLDAVSLFPFCVTVVIVLCARAVPAGGNTDRLVIGNERTLLILLILSAVFSLALLLSVALLARQEELERQRLLWNARKHHYENIEQNQLQIRRLRHDMANHLNAMAGMDDKSMREFLSELITAPAMTTGQRFCENETVNAVLSGKMPVIQRIGIQADLDVTLPSVLPVSDIDLCAICSNCIDNAIEACQKCEPENRIMKLQAKAIKGLFALQLENRMTGTLQERDGRLFTSKSDWKNHGLGMAGIRDIVEQHDGVLNYEQADDWFRLCISIPFAE